MDNNPGPRKQKIRLMRHNGTVRDINTPENQEYARLINKEIDTMIQYRAYNYVMQSLRSLLSMRQGTYKQHASKLLENCTEHIDNTSVGILKFWRVPLLSTRREFLDMVLERLKINIFDIEYDMPNIPKAHRFVINFNTVALKIRSEVTDKVKKLFDEFYAQLPNVSSEDHIHSFIALSIRWMLNHKSFNQLYLAAYNRVKKIFDEASRIKHFPRIYSYKGAVIEWTEIQAISSFSDRLFAYFRATDIELYHRFKYTLTEIHNEKQELRIMFSLDNCDYDFDEGDDDEYENPYDI